VADLRLAGELARRVPRRTSSRADEAKRSAPSEDFRKLPISADRFRAKGQRQIEPKIPPRTPKFPIAAIRVNAKPPAANQTQFWPNFRLCDELSCYEIGKGDIHNSRRSKYRPIGAKGHGEKTRGNS
jgi:hypothetical protein